MGPVASTVSKGNSFAKMVRSGTLGKSAPYHAQHDVGSKVQKLTIGMSVEPHACNVEKLVISQDNNLPGTSALAARVEEMLWEHLMKLKSELDSLIGLVQNYKVNEAPRPEPMLELNYTLCGYKLAAQRLVSDAKQIKPVLDALDGSSGIGVDLGIGKQAMGQNDLCCGLIGNLNGISPST